MNGHVRFGAVLAALGALGLIGIFACDQSVEGFLNERCARGKVETDPQGHRARAFTCRERPSALAADLVKGHKPADQRSTPEGHFLRYSDTMVGLTAQGTGTKAYFAEERDGYAFFGPYVGGWWGTYGGPAESFRGGGPAGGK